MIVEWECILDCNYKCDYCTNGRNSALDKPIRYEKDKSRVFKFLDLMKQKWPDDELFLFGGEPFLHPFLGEIIQHLNDIGMKFIIQTNGSISKRILELSKQYDFKIQVSVHPDEIKRPGYFEGLLEIQHLIRRIDVMYIGESSLQWYRKIHKSIDNKEVLYLAPLADFNIDGDIVNSKLFEYNEMKKSFLSKVYRFESGDRSYKWEEQMKGVWTPKGKPCLYQGQYILYDPQLKSYSCNYRQNNEICPNGQCFLM